MSVSGSTSSPLPTLTASPDCRYWESLPTGALVDAAVEWRVELEHYQASLVGAKIDLLEDICPDLLDEKSGRAEFCSDESDEWFAKQGIDEDELSKRMADVRLGAPAVVPRGIAASFALFVGVMILL